MFIERNGFMFEALASCYEAINELPEEFNLVEDGRGRLKAWQKGVSLLPILGVGQKRRQVGWGELFA